MKVVIDKSAIRDHRFGIQKPTLTIGKTSVVFNNKAAKILNLVIGSNFCFEFSDGILFLRLTEADKESFTITKNLGKSGCLIALNMHGLLEVVKKHCGYTSVKNLLFKIGDIKDGVYKLSYIPENAKEQDAASVTAAK